MAKVGMLVKEHDELRGSFRTLKMAARIVLMPRDGSPGGDTPTHEVAVTKDGETIVIGAAWTKHRKDGTGSFFSMTLDDPSWPQSLNLSAFPVDGKAGEFEIVWQRPRERDA